MRKFFIKILLFIVPFIILLNIPQFTGYIFNSDIKAKINTFVENPDKPIIIVGGDSRAERQIIPQILEEKFGTKTVNIATSAGDIVILYNALKEYDLISPKNVLIISISSVETNDSIIDKWGVQHAQIAHISTINQIKLFGKRYFKMMSERIRLIIQEIMKYDSGKVLTPSDRRFSTNGFYGVEGDISNIDFNDIDIYSDTYKIGWYLNANHDGARKQVFKKIMKKLADTDMEIIIFQPPISPSWLDRIAGTYIDAIEIEHSMFLKNIASQYKNVSLIDFYLNQNEIYTNDMFYNTIHFNVQGAGVFTNVLIDSLINRKLLPE